MVSRTGLASRRLLGTMALAVMLAGCASLKVGSDFDANANFSGYRTFSWMPREHHGTSNPLVGQRAHDAIEGELKRKGFNYMQDATAVDFVVDFTIGSHDRLDIQSYPAPYAGPWMWSYAGWWGRPYWGDEVDVRKYREGTLSVDVFDARSHKAVWHGWATKELSQADIDRSERPIRAAVAAVLERFPPK